MPSESLHSLSKYLHNKFQILHSCKSMGRPANAFQKGLFRRVASLPLLPKSVFSPPHLLSSVISLPCEPLSTLCCYHNFLLLRQSPLRFCRNKKENRGLSGLQKFRIIDLSFFFLSTASYVLSQLKLKGIYFSQSWYHLTFRLLWEDHFSIHSQLNSPLPR